MNRYFCDLHIHSCLSPCADDDMTPGNIAGMAALNGLQIVALTDHNTAGNCRSFFRQAKAMGLIPVPGMELTTAEDVHVVCLFRRLEDAEDFGAFVRGKLPPIDNRPDIFGHQYFIGEDDEIAGEESVLLLNASGLSIKEAAKEVASRGGVLYPAHIDRPSNGILGVLGAFPPEPRFSAYELKDAATDEALKGKHAALSGAVRTVSSDAHTLGDIAEAVFSLEIDDEPYSSALVRERLIDLLSGKR